MKEFIKRTTTAVFIVIGVYFLVKYLPLLYFSMVLYLVISLAVYEFLKLTRPVTHSFLLAFVSGLVIAFYFTLGEPDLLLSIMMVTIFAGLFFLFSIKKTEELNAFVKDIGIHFLVIFYLYIPLYFLFEFIFAVVIFYKFFRWQC